MIYLAAIALLLTIFGFIRKTRQNGLRVEIFDSIFAVFAGLAAGLFIGFGARIGMGAIAYSNGDAHRLSVSGSLQVILLFSSFGIGLGLFYALVLRDLLRRSGFAFGALITLCTLYPFSEAAVQVMRFQPTTASLIFFTGIFTALMWLPFAVALEKLLKLWQRGFRKAILSGLFCKKAETRL